MSDLFAHLSPVPSPAGRPALPLLGEVSAQPTKGAQPQPERESPPLAASPPVSPQRAEIVRLVVDNAKAARRDVLFFYVEGWAPPGSPRWEWRFNVEPVEAIARVLSTLKRRPEHVEIEKLRLGDIGVISAGPGEPRRPLCMIPEGLELGEALAGLALLTPRSLERRA